MDNFQPISPISEMPNLSARLGKSGCDRVRATTTKLPTRRSRHGFTNPIYTDIQNVTVDTYGVSDILAGIANSCGGDKPLNISRIFVLLQCLDYIDTRRVSIVTELSERTARNYVNACRLAIPYLQKLFLTGQIQAPAIEQH